MISPLFDVCASLNPTSDRYSLNRASVVDWDDGVLTIDGVDVDIYVGRQPDFDKQKRFGNYPTDRRFLFMGQEKGQGIKKLLFAQKYSKEADDYVYVMFSGKQLAASIEKALMQNDFLHGCKKP